MFTSILHILDPSSKYPLLQDPNPWFLVSGKVIYIVIPSSNNLVDKVRSMTSDLLDSQVSCYIVLLFKDLSVTSNLLTNLCIFKAGLSIRGFFARIRINPKIRKINPKKLGFLGIRNPKSETYNKTSHFNLFF